MKRFLLTSIIISSSFLTGCLEVDLPKCDDKDTTKTLSEIITKVLKDDGESYKFISSKNITEDGFNKETKIRVCSADVMFSNGYEERITYNVYWQNEKNAMFYVEIVD
ncbi:TPA: hypothetical protein ACK3JW_001396 [Mannheimia haemolytica]